MQAVGVTAEAAEALSRGDLKAQLLDWLDAAYPFPVLPVLVERELAVIWQAAESSIDIPEDSKAKAAQREEFRQ